MVIHSSWPGRAIKTQPLQTNTGMHLLTSWLLPLSKRENEGIWQNPDMGGGGGTTGKLGIQDVREGKNWLNLKKSPIN